MDLKLDFMICFDFLSILYVAVSRGFYYLAKNNNPATKLDKEATIQGCF